MKTQTAQLALTTPALRDSKLPVHRALFQNDVMLTAFQWRERWCWVAKDVGAALGYGHEARQFVQNFSQTWAEEAIEGDDFAVLKGADLAELKRLVAVHPDCGVSIPARAPALVVLYEEGINLALLKTEKPLGRQLRKWLRKEVLPALARGGSYEPVGAGDDVVLRLPRGHKGTKHLLESAAFHKRTPEEETLTLFDGAEDQSFVAFKVPAEHEEKFASYARTLGVSRDKAAGRAFKTWASLENPHVDCPPEHTLFAVPITFQAVRALRVVSMQTGYQPSWVARNALSNWTDTMLAALPSKLTGAIGD